MGGILALLPFRAFAVQSVTLAWDANPDPNVAGYNLYYGVESGTYPSKIPVGDVTSATVTGLVEGMTYYFVLTVHDQAGVESNPSNEVSYTVPGGQSLRSGKSSGTARPLFSSRPMKHRRLNGRSKRPGICRLGRPSPRGQTRRSRSRSPTAGCGPCSSG